MPEIFSALPGTEVPVGAIAKNLAAMWADTEAKGGPAPASDHGKATQVNFVLHLGFATTPADALEQFQTAVSFSRRYPCRVVVLCPIRDDSHETVLRAKIYGECHLGKSKGDTRCCEFVMLSYPLAARKYLEDQVSICLQTDLPLYYWAHRFSSSARLNDYQYLLRGAKRVLIDSSIVPADALTFPWPNPENVRDLVYARLLPIRQSVGQFLAAYEPATLVRGLTCVALTHAATLAAEGRVLAAWLQARLVACGAPGALVCTTAESDGGPSFTLSFRYDDARFFHWRGDLVTGAGYFDADLGLGHTRLPAVVKLLAPDAALGEAMFF